MEQREKIIIAGGGPAGLVAAIRLARQGFACTLIEKKVYPFHRVCGEYISNETSDFLIREKLYPHHLDLPTINQLELSSVSGKHTLTKLRLGGFGISRYAFDSYLADLAKAAGVNLLTGTEIRSINYQKSFRVTTSENELEADLVIGAFGKRSRLDVQLERGFIRKRSPYVGIKYHAKTTHPRDRIALHNFKGGYCGVNNIEDKTTNICYLVHRDLLKQAGSIGALENTVLSENPHLKKLFAGADFLFQKPEVINEISFETKQPVWNHIFMTGDAAGMIAPLCGNGLAIAIHSAKILTDLMIEAPNLSLADLEKSYTAQWRAAFSKRLWIGRHIQHKLFGTSWGSAIALRLAMNKRIIDPLVNLTHGKVF